MASLSCMLTGCWSLRTTNVNKWACKPHATLTLFLIEMSFLKLMKLLGCSSETSMQELCPSASKTRVTSIVANNDSQSWHLEWRLQHETNTQRTLPDEVGVGVGVAMSQVHNIVVMGEGECESKSVLRGSLPASHTTLVVANAASSPGPARTL